MLTQEQNTLFQLILAADRHGANDFVDDWAKSRSYSASLLELLEPAISEFGKVWASSDNISLAQGG